MSGATAPNSRNALAERRAEGVLTWPAPVLMLLARPVLAVAAQGLAAIVLAVQGSAAPWRDAAPWLPVYGTLIDVGCLALLWRLSRREGMTLLELMSFDAKRLGRDMLLGIALIMPGLVFILAGNLAANLLVYGTFGMPRIFSPLPLAATVYGVRLPFGLGDHRADHL